MEAEDYTSQQLVLEFLSQSSSYDGIVPVRKESSFSSIDLQVIKTHSAIVFLIRNDVFKVKRSIAFSYLDMSTLEARHRLCLREFDLNRQMLPDIYLAVVPVSEKEGGGLTIGGQGKPVEWAIHMRRFPEARVLDRMASAGRLDNQLAGEIGAAIAEYHEMLLELKCMDGYARIREVMDELIHELNALTRVFTAATIDDYSQQLHAELHDCRKLLDERATTGFVKRCHGDLHLRNLVMHKGIPTPFDALEFNERMATTDVLYDLAFLVMDLGHRDLHDQANRVLNLYLLHSDIDNLGGLRLLPVFLSCRACIRAMTTAQVITADPAKSPVLTQEAIRYLDLAIQYLEIRSPVLIAIGGLSGTGKTTVALQLAPLIGQHPGAVTLRSDAERKIAEGVTETTRLPDEHYSSEMSERNYRLLQRKSKMALNAGLSVIVDAVFLDAEQRDAIEQCAKECGCTFFGFWLTADVPLLEQRIDSRVDDASDATVEILSRQLTIDEGVVHWSVVNAEGSRDEVFSEVWHLMDKQSTH